MSSTRLQATNYGDGIWSVAITPIFLQGILRSPPITARPIFLRGYPVFEEVSGYTSARVGFSSHSLTIIGSNATLLPDILKWTRRGNSNLINRVHRFISTEGFTFTQPIAADLIEYIISAPAESLLNSMQMQYTSHKRIKSRQPGDVKLVLEWIQRNWFDGPVVMLIQRDVVTYEQAIALRMWDDLGRKHPAVFLVSAGVDVMAGEAILELPPISFADAVALASTALVQPLDEVRRNAELWFSTLDNRQKRRMTASMSRWDVQNLLSAVSQMGAPPITVEQIASSIPKSIPAPVMFQEARDCIDLDHVEALGASRAVSMGAARALKSQVLDVLASGTVENAVPRLAMVLHRVHGVLERLLAANCAEVSDIIEFGVEISYLSSRIYEARSRIGELSSEELLSFIGEASKFISRFNAWRDYERETTDGVALGADSQVSVLAAEILRTAMRSGLLSEDAIERIDLSLDTAEIDDSAHREGLARTTENFTAALGRGALRKLKEGGNQIVDESTKKIAGSLSEMAHAFIIQHSGGLSRFAQARAGKWLEMVISLLDKQS